MDHLEVLEFWFGDAATRAAGTVRDEWFSKDEAFDTLIRERFGASIGEALAGGLQGWLAAPDSALAYVVLLDQFTRNAWRGSARAFAGDSRSLLAARRMVSAAWDRPMPTVMRWFCYLPFEHSESILDQHESLRLFNTLGTDPLAVSAQEWARKHHDVIERFGRFPHRNEVLGRASTAQEIEFLKQPGSRF